MKNLQLRYVNLAKKIADTLPHNRLTTINFNRPWYKTYLSYAPMQLALMVVSSLVSWGFIFMTPYLFTFAFVNLRFDWILYIFIVRLILLIYSKLIQDRIELNFTTNIQNSIYFSSISKLIQVDPIHHAYRETGVILAKINRTHKAIASITGIALNDIMITVTGAIISIFTLATVDLRYGLAAAIFIILIIFANVIANVFNSQATDHIVLGYEDKSKQEEVSLISQIAYVRSIFATDIGFRYLQDVRMDFTKINWASDYLRSLLYSLVVFSYYGGLFVISYLLLQEVQQATLDTAIALGLISTYLYNTGSLFNIGSVAKKLAQDIIYIDDFFKFVDGYGQQTFPVLS